MKICGWGRISDSMLNMFFFINILNQNFIEKLAQVSEDLHCARVGIVPENVCRQMFGPTITSGTICQSAYEMKGTCEGDSGGPMTAIGSENKEVLIGVTSFSTRTGCSNTGPRVFTRVSEYLDWIDSKTSAIK